jgi:hypothetical protein
MAAGASATPGPACWTAACSRSRPALADARSLLRGFAPPDGPALLALVDELMELAAFSTRGELLARVRERLGRCWFTREKVKRAGEPAVVECLTIEDDSVALSVPDARWILGEWMRVDSLEHYRVALRRSDAVRPHTVAYYEPAGRRGKFAVVMPPTPPVELTALQQPPSPWDDALLALLEATDEVSGAVASDGLP